MRDLFFFCAAPLMRATGAAPDKANFRADIQALRGVAVLLVVLYHSGLGVFGAGYVGVDMFFVISGFLITGIVARSVATDEFSLAEFYSRRVRRLLPAAYAVLTATSVFAAVLLTSSQYWQFFRNLVGSLFFSANFTLWSQTGYFKAEAAYEPLLHMWSLAIEEQYYLLLPLILFFVPKRLWLATIVLASAGSLIAGVYLATVKPSVAFFWLPFRAWELGLGSIGALIWRIDRVSRIARYFIVPGLAGVILTPIWQMPGPTPGLGAIVTCLSTLIIVLANDARASSASAVRLFAWVGDFSYSLYLVHWPLFALVRASNMSTDLTPTIAILLIGISFALAWLLYRFVEEPLRCAPIAGRTLLTVALGVSIAVGVLAWTLGTLKADAVTANPFRNVVGLSDQGCFQEIGARFDGQCSQSTSPEILLWGDSYSAHLVPGLDATTRRPFVQASLGQCSPFANYAVVASANEFEWTKGCLAFNASVIDYARRTASLKVVILTAQYTRTLTSVAGYAITTDTNGSVKRRALGMEPTIEAQAATVAKLRSLGLRVVVVAPTTPSEFDMGICWQRKAENVVTFGSHRNCELRQNNPARAAAQFDDMMKGFEERADVPVISLEEALCWRGICQTEIDRKPLFRDTGHFTEWGSLVVGKRLKLGHVAWELAR